MNKKYIYNSTQGVYYEFSDEEFQNYCKKNLTDDETVYIYDEFQSKYVGFPVKIALDIMKKRIELNEFMDNIKKALMIIV